MRQVGHGPKISPELRKKPNPTRPNLKTRIRPMIRPPADLAGLGSVGEDEENVNFSRDEQVENRSMSDEQVEMLER